MMFIQAQLERRPLISVTLVVVLSVSLLFLIKWAGFYDGEAFNWPRLLVQNTVSLALIFLLYRLGWGAQSGLTSAINRWHRWWFLAMLPMLLLGLLNITGVPWEVLQFRVDFFCGWLLANFSTGLFEEVLMRGFAFYVLYRAWGDSKSGLYAAAITQALIFGVAHFVNLYQMPFLDVTAQVVYATLLGFGFAGLVYFTGSIWPAVIIHFFINSIGTIDEYFDPSYRVEDFSGPGLAGYLVAITIILVISTMPGAWFLNKAHARIA